MSKGQTSWKLLSRKQCLNPEEAAEPSFVKTVRSTALAAKRSGPGKYACRNDPERRAVAQAKPVLRKSSPRLAEGELSLKSSWPQHW